MKRKACKEGVTCARQPSAHERRIRGHDRANSPPRSAIIWRDELAQVMRDLREAGCDAITIGQYLAPSDAHFPIARFVEPHEFDDLAAEARGLGFRAVASAPLVRSSYNAADMMNL